MMQGELSSQESLSTGKVRAYVVFNCASGSADRGKFFKILEERFPADKWAFEIFEIVKSVRKKEIDLNEEGSGIGTKIKKFFHVKAHETITDYVIWSGIPHRENNPNSKFDGVSNEDLDKALMFELNRIKEWKFDFVFAAGGDGTVSWVTNGMVGSTIPIVVVPLGTGNAIAQELGIPRGAAALEEVLKFYSLCLVPSTHESSPSSSTQPTPTTTPVKLVPDGLHRRRFDLIKMKDEKGKDHYIVLHVDVGLGAITVAKAESSHKKFLGTPAYLVSMARTAWKHKPVHFRLTIDEASSDEPLTERSITWEDIHQTHREDLDLGKGIYNVEASEIVVCNSSVIGLNPGITWGNEIYPDDGILNIAVFKLTNAGHYAEVLNDVVVHGNAHHNDKVTYLKAKASVRIEVVENYNAEERQEGENKEREIKEEKKKGENGEVETELPIQADGEVAGRTPVYVEIVPSSVTFVATHLGGGYVSKTRAESLVHASITGHK